uniref:Uncharacterized protein n=1 Tax=viral metagenome TaxID=1070528 RepID=A0A6C0KB99_9ZZZZ
MENTINIEDIFKGILTGFFASYLIILGMRPAAIYPDNILDIIDNPWIFLILFIINYYVLYWDITVGLLLFLTLIALIIDIVIFTDGDFLKDNMISFNDMGINDNSGDTATVSATAANSANADKSYKDINDIVLEKLIYYNKSKENGDAVKSSNAFL